MPRPITAAQCATAATVVLVRTGVPAAAGESHPAAERHRVVDDHDLLVMDRTGRVAAVDGEVQSLVAYLVQQRHRGDAIPDVVEDRQQAQIGFQYVARATRP